MSDANGLPRVFVIGADDYRALSLRDLIEASDVAGADVSEIATLRGSPRIRALAALAWVITRRSEPGLTFEQVLDGRVEPPAEPASPLADAPTRS